MGNESLDSTLGCYNAVVIRGPMPLFPLVEPLTEGLNLFDMSQEPQTLQQVGQQIRAIPKSTGVAKDEG